ncbi:MAG: response regulator [Candidatus Nomurabacteria bacterium]|nr:MAG: response regulator [Candidatus Nomurabacteria bacterium]
MTSTNDTRSILVVEDEPELAEIYRVLLAQAGYDVTVMHNGKDALKYTSEKSPDLILLDLRMPIMDGVEFLKKYELKDKHPKVKVVVFSNYDMQDEIDDAYRLGAERYVLKAWASPKELLQIVKDSIG